MLGAMVMVVVVGGTMVNFSTMVSLRFRDLGLLHR